jgi:hypothetical protein
MINRTPVRASEVKIKISHHHAMKRYGGVKGILKLDTRWK